MHTLNHLVKSVQRALRQQSLLLCASDLAGWIAFLRNVSTGSMTEYTYRNIYLLPLTKEEVNAFAGVCLSVCLLAGLLKNACMDLDEMLWVARCRDMDELINF